MKKEYLSCLLLLLLLGFQTYSQTSCEENIEKAKKILKNKSPFDDGKEVFSLASTALGACNDANTKNFIGLLYIEGIGTDKDEEKGHELIKIAANAGFVDAQFNLGFNYKYAVGCEANYQKAIEWFEKASNQGHQKASYSIGYMYFKGFSVAQDYKKAVYWFEESEDPMAKYYLGLCYYLGYGVTTDETKAIEILTGNPNRISETLLKYIYENRKENIDLEVQEEYNATTSISTNNLVSESFKAATSIEIDEATTMPTEERILGEWEGKFIQYDWSGEKIVRILPISLSIKNNGDNLLVNSNLLDTNARSKASYEDGNLYFSEPFNFTIDRLYDDGYEKVVKHSFLTANLIEREIGENTYLTANLDTYISKWSEYGRPSRLVLKSKKTNSDNNELENEEFLEDIFEGQEHQFIKLYPVPFKSELNVQYQLDKEDYVYIELVGVNGGSPTIIKSNEIQAVGNYDYKIPIHNLATGLYVVRLIAGNETYTRLITKEN